MASKLYAVRRGRKTGIFNSWAQCKAQIDGFSGAVYKSFPTLAEAEAYLAGGSAAQVDGGAQEIKAEAIAYVDGSYNQATKEFSYGAVIFYQGQTLTFAQKFQDAELAEMRNVAGEIKGAERAMQFCLDEGISSLAIYHDYEGIASWCTGAWQAKKAGTQAYRDFYQMARQKVQITFVKDKGHSGVAYNEMADQLAKNALAK